jgi:hypothetical protein
MDHAEIDLTLQLPRDVYHQLIHTLRAALPPVTDAPEDLARRDNAAIALVASLLPATADEANLAAQYAAASAQAIECLRQGQEHRGNPTIFLKCGGQADRAQRQARGFRAMLLRVQAERRKRETDNAAIDRAAWTEHCAIRLMADALGRAPLAVMVEPPPAPDPDPVREAEPKAAPQAEIAAEADFYAAAYPQRAARIRVLGGLPAKLDFGPPSPELVHAIVTGTSPALQALSTTDHHATTAVA